MDNFLKERRGMTMGDNYGLDVMRYVDARMLDIQQKYLLPMAVILGTEARQALKVECMKIMNRPESEEDLMLHRYRGVIVIEDAEYKERVEVVAGTRNSVASMNEFFQILSKGT